MTTTTTDPTVLREAMVGRLVADKTLTASAWVEAFRAVPRHVFAPAVYLVDDHGRPGRVLHGDNPDTHAEWLRAVYTDDAIVTQVSPDGRPTSSSTQPGIMATMLHALDVHDDARVLEIGTGTGYNAALLAHRLGDNRVATIDIDARLATQACTALESAGYRPTVLAGDGLVGVADRAPFDRIIATCSTRRVPVEWVRQTVPGGVVVANLGVGVVPLRVAEDGSASGRFLPEVAAFIEARHADGPPGPSVDEVFDRCMHGQGTVTPTGGEIVEWDDPGYEFVRRLCLPDVRWCGAELPDEFMHCLADDQRSWARAQLPTALVAQGGPRRLWDDVAVLWLRWVGWGRPAHDRLGVSVDPAGGQTVWVDEPHNLLFRF